MDIKELPTMNKGEYAVVHKHSENVNIFKHDGGLSSLQLFKGSMYRIEGLIDCSDFLLNPTDADASLKMYNKILNEIGYSGEIYASYLHYSKGIVICI